MTTPSEDEPAPPVPAPVAADAREPRERRLHPWSWLFVLVQQLKQFALPLLILLFTGSGDRNEFWPMIGVGVLALVSVVQYFTYRYRVGAEGLTIRSGVVQRTVRHIPFDRVHNVALQQSLLHRWFGVAEVRLESAGGVTPEASMRVLALADAHALERIVRQHALAAHGADGAAATGDDAPPLLALDARELVRLGLISNRGMLVVAALMGFIAQTDSKLFGRLATEAGKLLLGWSERLHLETAGYVAGAIVLLVAAMGLLRVLSVVIAFLQFHGFVLRAHGDRLHVQRGLLTLLRGSLPRDRIQSFELQEGLLHRWFGRRSLKVDTMAMQSDAEGRSLRHLAPLATPPHMDALVADLLPRAAWPPSQWRSLHPRAWWRVFLPAALFWSVAAIALAIRFGAPGALALLGVPWAAWSARRWAAHAGYAEEGGLVAVREGWLDRHWRFAETRKVQGLRLSRSPLDRRFGMASLLLDTAGVGPGVAPLRVRFLPVDEARALYARLAAALAQSPAGAPRSRRVTRARSAATAAPAP
jgi:putative membrane protein